MSAVSPIPAGRVPFVAGNWKMYRTPSEARALARAIREGLGGDTEALVALVPSFVCIAAVAEAVAGSAIEVGAQNLHWEREGAYTGEVSGAMVREAGATWVVVGHSERRRDFGESDAVVARKVAAAFSCGLRPIVCLGETLEEREGGATRAVVERQFAAALDGAPREVVERLVVAYEPVWAIGTGRTASPEMAGEVHALLRGLARDRWGEAAAALRIVYGGSVKSDNVAALAREPQIDGFLVGGASLDPQAFIHIVHAAGRRGLEPGEAVRPEVPA